MNMKKVHVEMVSKMLLPVQNELQKELCSDHLQHTQNELDLLKSVIVMRLGYLPNLETSDIHCTRSHQTLQEQNKFACVVRRSRPC
jgi:hypothetical protein